MQAIPAVAFAENPAFDQVAETYDADFTHSSIGKAQRELVHRVLLDAFHPGQHVLELNCGTGEDALMLASAGIRVFACDVSPRMIEVATRKAAGAASGQFAEFEVCSNEQLASVAPEAPFDGAFSNFGGLNCTADLSAVARELGRLIQPGGQAVVCLMGRHCAWEMIAYAMQRKWRKAIRRMKPGGTRSMVGGSGLNVYYPSVHQIRRAFASQFRLQEWRGVGVSVPPSWMEAHFENRADLLKLLVSVDQWLGRAWLFRALADHLVFRFVRISS